ncbi:MAG: hypothetical protein RR327_05825 [Clostridia bacterium]
MAENYVLKFERTGQEHREMQALIEISKKFYVICRVDYHLPISLLLKYDVNGNEKIVRSQGRFFKKYIKRKNFIANEKELQLLESLPCDSLEEEFKATCADIFVKKYPCKLPTKYSICQVMDIYSRNFDENMYKLFVESLPDWHRSILLIDRKEYEEKEILDFLYKGEYPNETIFGDLDSTELYALNTLCLSNCAENQYETLKNIVDLTYAK